MRFEIVKNKLVFEQSDGGVRRSHDLVGTSIEIYATESAIVIDHAGTSLTQRMLFKYDRFGQQRVVMFLSHDWPVSIAENDRSYSIDGIARSCVAQIWHVSGREDGETVVLQPTQAPDPTRNLYRYNHDGSLRWQMGQRDFRPTDRIITAEFLSNGNVRARASYNGWSAEIDDATGDFLRVVATNER